MLSKALGLVSIFLVVLGASASTLAFSARWGNRDLNEFIRTVEYIINTLKARGVDVTLSLDYLQKAKDAAEEGNYAEAKVLAIQALRIAGREAKLRLNITVPRAVGLVKMSSMLELAIKTLKDKVNETEVLNKLANLENMLTRAKELLAEGRVREAVHTMMNISMSLREIAIEQSLKHMEVLSLKLISKFRERHREHIRKLFEERVQKMKHFTLVKQLMRRHLPGMGNVFVYGILHGLRNSLLRINLTINTLPLDNEIKVKLNQAINLTYSATFDIEKAVQVIMDLDYRKAEKYLEIAETKINESLEILNQLDLVRPYKWVVEVLKNINTLLQKTISRIKELREEIPLPEIGSEIRFRGIVLRASDNEALVVSIEKVVCIMVVGVRCPPHIWRVWKINYTGVNVTLKPGMKIYVEGVIEGIDETLKIPIVKANKIEILTRGIMRIYGKP